MIRIEHRYIRPGQAFMHQGVRISNNDSGFKGDWPPHEMVQVIRRCTRCNHEFLPDHRHHTECGTRNYCVTQGSFK